MSKVICNKSKTCKHKDICGASVSHYETSCEPCPFDKDAKCEPVKAEGGD